MRTTVTLDDDVVELIDEVRLAKRLTFREAVNQGLREGLSVRATEPVPKRSWTHPVDMGMPLFDLTSTSEALEYAEGPGYK
ncbi:MAG TPA: antitoxin [Chloroflexota bacterium]|nr:antitoxin [Chloroflexota bacterium]